MEEALWRLIEIERFAKVESEIRAFAEKLRGASQHNRVSRDADAHPWWQPLADSWKRNESQVYRNSRDFIQDQLNGYVWFGVDIDGFIGMFFNDGTGPVPCSFAGKPDDALEFLMPLAKHLGKNIEENRFDVNDDNNLGLCTYFSGIGTYPPTAEGKWEIDVRSRDFVIDCYEKKISVPHGLHISMLPDFLKQEVMQTAQFEVRFFQTEYIQPALKMPCLYWPTDDNPEIKVADVDGKLKILPPELRLGTAFPPLPKPSRPPEYQNLKYPKV